MRLIERMPLLVLAGGGLLGYIAGDMAAEDPAVAPWIAAHAPSSTGSLRSSASRSSSCAGLWLAAPGAGPPS